LASIWNIWYHFSLPQHDLDLVREQASKLLSISESAEEWSKSPYAAIKFVSLHTLDEARKYWIRYADPKDSVAQVVYDASRRGEIQKVYDEMYAPGGESSTFYAGTHWAKGLDTMNVALRGFWKTGVVAGNATDIQTLGSGPGYSNPLVSHILFPC
jgi:hypothetical protein